MELVLCILINKSYNNIIGVNKNGRNSIYNSNSDSICNRDIRNTSNKKLKTTIIKGVNRNEKRNENKCKGK